MNEQLTKAKRTLLENIDKLEVRFDALSNRERFLALGAALLAVYFIWSAIVFDVLLADQSTIEKNIETARNTIASLKAQTGSIATVLSTDQNQPLVDRIKKLKQDNQEIQEKMVKQTKQMVSPKEMAIIVKTLVEKTQGLSVNVLKSVESKPLFKIDPKNTQFFQVYQHTLELEMMGSYFETLQFLESMEKQESKVLWSGLFYEVQQYPKAKIRLLIDTLGLEEAWIGV